MAANNASSRMLMRSIEMRRRMGGQTRPVGYRNEGSRRKRRTSPLVGERRRGAARARATMEAWNASPAGSPPSRSRRRSPSTPRPRPSRPPERT